MYPRTNYEMTVEDLNKILEACKPVPAILLQCGNPPSPQESVNAAWEELGKRMGFDHMTVQPTGYGDRFFTAVPSETPEQRERRETVEREAKRTAEIERLRNEIKEREERLKELNP